MQSKPWFRLKFSTRVMNLGIRIAGDTLVKLNFHYLTKASFEDLMLGNPGLFRHGL